MTRLELPSATPRVSVPAVANRHDLRRSGLRSVRFMALLSILVAVLGVSSHARGSTPTTQASSSQPELPIAAAFVYPWYPSHWSAWIPAGEIFPLANYERSSTRWWSGWPEAASTGSSSRHGTSGTECGSQPDSWHEYDPSKPVYWHDPYSASLSPGFWAYGNEETLPRNTEVFEALVEWMAGSGVDWQLITTWNEWIEGTTIEPTQEYGQTYIDILCAHLPGSVPCESGAANPTPPPSPTPPGTPSPGPTSTPSVPPGPPAPAPTSVRLGDVDCDADVDSLDALKILASVAFGTLEQPLACAESVDAIDAQISGDVDCDHDVDSVDALKILQFVASVPFSQKMPCVAIGEPVSPA